MKHYRHMHLDKLNSIVFHSDFYLEVGILGVFENNYCDIFHGDV